MINLEETKTERFSKFVVPVSYLTSLLVCFLTSKTSDVNFFLIVFAVDGKIYGRPTYRNLLVLLKCG